jgi:multisubunit Na+/H+ antiporter MnhF subunit
MNEWLIAAVVLFGGLLVLLPLPSFYEPISGLVVLQVGGTLLTSILLLLSEGIEREPFADLALVFAPLAFVGSLAFARILERRI